MIAYLIKEGKFEEADNYEKSFGSCKAELIKAGIILNNPATYENAILSNKFTGVSADQLIDSFLKDYRDKFKNKKTGAIGSRSGCIKKFKLFFQEYPEYMDKDLILNATDRYINSCRKDGFKFLMQADYFIYKMKDDGGGNTSTLATYCEEIEENFIQSSGKRMLGL